MDLRFPGLPPPGAALLGQGSGGSPQAGGQYTGAAAAAEGLLGMSTLELGSSLNQEFGITGGARLVARGVRRPGSREWDFFGRGLLLRSGLPM